MAINNTNTSILFTNSSGAGDLPAGRAGWITSSFSNYASGFDYSSTAAGFGANVVGFSIEFADVAAATAFLGVASLTGAGTFAAFATTVTVTQNDNATAQFAATHYARQAAVSGGVIIHFTQAPNTTTAITPISGSGTQANVSSTNTIGGANTRVTTPVTDFDKSTSLPGLKLPSGDNSNQPAGAAAAQGMIRNDTEETIDSSRSAIAHYNGTNWQYFAATESAAPVLVDYLVIAGGGGASWGGGGAGGLRTSFGSGNNNGGLQPVGVALTTSATITYTVVVGSEGAAGNGSTQAGSDGASSSFLTITSDGGIGGDGNSQGGDGGKAGGTSIYGFAGGNNDGNSGCGGGGAGAVGAQQPSSFAGSNGGAGLEVNIIGGTGNFYAGGGGGGNRDGSGTGSGGSGGGGNASSSYSANNAQPGTPNTGGGGGGASYNNAGSWRTARAGGSGVVILRYPIANNVNITTGTSPIAADLNATVAGSTTEKFTRFTATGTVTFTIT